MLNLSGVQTERFEGIGANGRKAFVDVVTDPAARKALGLPEKIDAGEMMTGTASAFLSNAETKIDDLRQEAVKLAKRAAAAEFAVDFDRVAAGLKFIELRAAVQAEGHSWEQWFARNVEGVSIRTAQRYMALATAPERQPSATEREPIVILGEPGAGPMLTPPTTEDVAPAEAKESAKKSKRVADEKVSAKVTIGRLVKRLDEGTAVELLAAVKAWIEERAGHPDHVREGAPSVLTATLANPDRGPIPRTGTPPSPTRKEIPTCPLRSL